MFGRVLGEMRTAEKHAWRAGFHSRAKFEAARQAGREAVLLDFAEPTTLPPAMASSAPRARTRRHWKSMLSRRPRQLASSGS
jgi:hypothetical protein